MKNTFENVASSLDMPLIYANPALANLDLDNLAPEDFSPEGLVLIVSPIYGNQPFDEIGRVKRELEVGIFGMLDLDFNDTEADALIAICESKINLVVQWLNLDVQNVNTLPFTHDAGLGGVFTTAFYTDTGSCAIFESELAETVTETGKRAVRSSGIWKAIKEASPEIEIDNEVTELSPNPVRSSGIWRAIRAIREVRDWAAGFFNTIFSWINNETAGTITKDVEGNIVSVTTFDETTTFNRNAENEITGWETPEAVYEFTYDAEGEITGWTFTKK